jgi:hypothetical protein
MLSTVAGADGSGLAVICAHVNVLGRPYLKLENIL